MSKYKYRGKYTNARDCVHALPTAFLMSMVKVKESCPQYFNTLFHFVPTAFCQHVCEKYQRAEGSEDNAKKN